MKRAQLAGATAALFVAVGAGGIAAPRFAAGAYGIATGEPDALAYVRAAAVRDFCVGSIVLAVLADDALLRRVLWCALPVSIADALIVASRRGIGWAHVIHGGGTVAMAALAVLPFEKRD